MPFEHDKRCCTKRLAFLNLPPRHGAESSTLMPHTESANTSYSPVHTAKTTLSGAFGTTTCANRQRKRAWNANCVQAQSVGRVVSLDRHWHRPAKGEGAFVWEPPLREQFSGVSRKQNEILKCNLLPSEECQVVGGQLPPEGRSTKSKRHPSGCSFFWPTWSI